MIIRSLGYVGVYAAKPRDWLELATGLLGMQAVEVSDSHVTLRMDEREQRLTVVPGEQGGIAFLGWELADDASLNELCARLEASGVRCTREPDSLARLRGVAKLVSFDDPEGNRSEAFWGPQTAGTPFQPSRNISGFVTGDVGVGHIALTVKHIGPMLAFYRDVLEFKDSDWVLQPFHVHFLHTNSRHHSLGLLQTGTRGVHHLMIELFHLDDVGQGYDRALTEEGRVSVTLGRHTNDYMTSFYINTPSNFLLEYGWGGRNVDDEKWEARELTEGPSIWGHERSWLPPEGRAEALRMRLKAADDGVRAPVQVLPGNHLSFEPGRR